MSNPHLIALAANIADYCVTNEHKDQVTTQEEECGVIRYTDECQETFNERYIYILDELEETFNGKFLRIQEGVRYNKKTNWRTISHCMEDNQS
jgi:hypothetical protein